MKKRYLFLILIIGLFAVSAVSAEEIDNKTNMITNSHDSLISESADNNFLSESYGTFEELQEEINAIGDGGTLNLTKNYRYVLGSIEGVNIYKPITIDGNGFVLDGEHSSRVLNITANDVVLKNLYIINGYCKNPMKIPWGETYFAGGILWNGENGILINSTLSENKGSAIGWLGNNGTITDSNIIKNLDSYAGAGGIYWIGDNGTIVNSNISSNVAPDNSGGGIMWKGNNGKIINSTFFNNTECSVAIAGAISWGGENGIIANSSFINNAATQANSIAWYGKNGIVTNSFFSEPHAWSVVEWGGENGTLSNSLFELQKETYLYRVIWNGDYGKITNVTFNNSNPSIDWKGKYGKFSPTITASDITNIFLNKTYFYAKFFDNKAKPLEYGDVSFLVDNDYYNMKTDERGVAKLDINLSPGNYTIISYNAFNNESLKNKITILPSDNKANTKLSIENISTTFYSNEIKFVATVNAYPYKVNEGKVKFFVNDREVGSSNVEKGIANLDYIAPSTGIYTLKAVFEKTTNFLSSEATSTFNIVKMPTTLSGNSIIFDDGDVKTYTTSLVDINNNGVNNKSIEILVIKYSGEYSHFFGTTDSQGITIYDVNSLKGGIWYVSGTFDGDKNYINSSLNDRFIIIKVKTTTNIEEIDNPQVNHTYKLKANIHDEDGKLVKEGIVQFYLDGVDIGSIDLSKHNVKSNNGLLGVANPIFDDKLCADEEVPYLEYTPTKSGNFKLSAIYKGTEVYKSSNYTTDFIVSEGNEYNLSAPDVVKYYHGPERFVVTVKDRQNNPVVDGEVTITLNGVPYNRTTDANGQASMAINLISGVHQVTSEFGDIKVQSTVTVKPTISGNNVTKIYRNDTQYYATFKDSNGNLLRNTDVNFNINGVFYTRKTNDAGVARMNINLLPGEYIITAYNPSSTEQSGNLIKVLPSIITYDLTKYYKNASALTFRLLNNQGRPVGAGVSATININGVFYTRQTNASGYVNMNINLIPGTYIATLNYNGLMASSTVKILPILEAKDVVMKYRDGTKFEAKLLDGQGKPFAGQTLIFNINGVMYNRITGDDGIARLNINLMPGEYIITSMYSNGAAISNKITIRSNVNANTNIANLKSPEEQYFDILGPNGANGYVYYPDGTYEHFVNDIVVDATHYGYKI